MNLESIQGRQNTFTAFSGESLTSQLKIKDEVHIRLQKLIYQGIFQPGDQLPSERNLAIQLGVSRPTLREGIGVLAATGVIRTRKGVGSFVVETNKNDVFDHQSLPISIWLNGFSNKEVSQVQLSIEMDTVGLAAQNATSEHLVGLSEKVADMFASLDNIEEFLVHEREFHQIMASASGNKIFQVILDAIYKTLNEEASEILIEKKKLKERAESHRQIYRCIRERNVESARNCMSEYLTPKK